STPPPTSAREPDAPTSVEPPPLLVERPAEEPLEATELLPGFAEPHLPDPAPRMDATRTDSARADSNSAAVAFAAPGNSPGSATMPLLPLVGVSVGIIASLAGVGWTVGSLLSADAAPESAVAAREDEEQPAAAVAHQPAPTALEPVP